VIQVAPGTKVYLATRPVSMRYGFDGLAAQIANVLQADPYSGHVFIFRGKRGDYLKLLYWDGSGLCLFAKRLEQGRFVWPPIIDGALILTLRNWRCWSRRSIGGARWQRCCQLDRRWSDRLLI
jgi:transposase